MKALEMKVNWPGKSEQSRTSCVCSENDSSFTFCVDDWKLNAVAARDF